MQAAAMRNNSYAIRIARQAIHDRNNRVFGYELLYRNSEDEGGANGDQASSRVLINSLMEIGLPRIVGDHYAFINLTDSLFHTFLDLPLDGSRVVLEVLEHIEPTPEVLAAIAELARRGMPIALDDYAFEPRWDPLLPLASIVKVEIPAVDLERLPAQLDGLRARGLKLLAEKVETPAEYHRLRAMGFDYFQGFYFARPEIVAGRRLGESQHLVLRLIATLNDPDSSLDQIERLIAGDAVLSLKILRYINSAAIGGGRKIASIRQATVLMGRERLRALASLVALSRIEGKSQELFNQASVRANLCASLARELGSAREDAAYTVGLLSILDALLGVAMDEILSGLDLDTPLEQALRHRAGPLGEILRCVLSLERNDLKRDDSLPIGDQQLHGLWLDALEKTYALEQSVLKDGE